MRSSPGFVITILILAAAVPAQAQIVNVLTPKVEEPKTGFGFKLGQSTELRQGNTEYLSLAADISLGYVRGDHQLKLLTAADLQFVDGLRKLNHQFGHLRYIWEFHPGLALYLFAQAERDEFRDLELRAVGGAGLEIELAATDWVRAALAISIMPEYELVTNEDEHEGEGGYTTRLSPYFTIAVKLAPWVTAASTTFLQPGMPQGDFRVFHEDALLVDITKHFGLKLAFKATHDSDPPLGIEGTDLSIKQGFSLKF